MMASKIEYYEKIVPDAFHGTDIDASINIARDKCFNPKKSDSAPEKLYLGTGVYFYEGSLESAKIWGRRKAHEKKKRGCGVIKAVLTLGRYLDYNIKEHAQLIVSTANWFKSRGIQNISDAIVINHINNICPLDSVRATHFDYGSSEMFKGSRFHSKTSTIICMKNPGLISNIELIYQEMI